MSSDAVYVPVTKVLGFEWPRPGFFFFISRNHEWSHWYEE